MLEGFGTAVPSHAVAQEEAALLHASYCGLDAARTKTLRALYRRSGVRKRHSAILDASEGDLDDRQHFYPRASDPAHPGPTTAERMARYEAAAPTLAVDAATAALADADLSAAVVTHLVTVSCTGFMSPGVDARIASSLGLTPALQRTHVGFMGCHGALNGMRVADAIVSSTPGAVALVCAVELCSLHFAYGWDPEMMVANALFADGAGAVVGRSGEARGDGWRIEAFGTHHFEGSEGDMSWRVGDHGFRMTLSARVPELIEARLGTWMRDWLCGQGLHVDDVATWAIHPGGPRIVDAVERAVGVERGRAAVSRQVLSELGNMSSATILFILQRLRRLRAPRPCVAVAFGPGLVAEIALIL